MKRGDAEGYFGLKLANEAVALQPLDLDARTASISLSLEKAIDRVGFNAFPAQDRATFASAVAAGPTVLAEVLRKAVADGKDELAAAAATALGQVTEPALLSVTAHPHPLVGALSAPAHASSSPPPRLWWSLRRRGRSPAPAGLFPPWRGSRRRRGRRRL